MSTPTFTSHWRTLDRQIRTALASELRQGTHPHTPGDIDDLRHTLRRSPMAVRDHLVAHQSGQRRATLALLLSQLPMLVNVSRHVHVDDADFTTRTEVQMQCAVTGFLGVLDRVAADDEHLVHKLYWYSLHAVTTDRKQIATVAYPDMTADFDYPAPSPAPEPGDAVAELLDRAHAQSGKRLSARDEQILRAMYARADVVSVGQVAAELGLTEDAAESRLRRATARLRDAIRSVDNETSHNASTAA